MPAVTQCDWRARRIEAGFSRAEIAALSGVSIETIGNIERGQHKPRPTTIAALERALNHGVKELHALAVYDAKKSRRVEQPDDSKADASEARSHEQPRR